VRATGNAGIRFLIAVVVLVLALFVEYAVTDGGVLRRLTGAARPSRDAPAAEASRPPESPRAEAPAAPVAPPPAPPPASPPPTARPGPARPPVFLTNELPLRASFEDGEEGWGYDARGGDGLGARTSDAARAGRFALLSQASEAAQRGWPGWLHGTRVKVAPGATYVFRAWAASPDGGNGWLDLQLVDAANTYLGGRSTGCSRERPGRQWELLELRYVNDDPRVASVQLALLHCLNHTRGRATTLYFDDVSFAASP
jgi:hypothetical protein